jgi:hypothetical protein
VRYVSVERKRCYLRSKAPQVGLETYDRALVVPGRQYVTPEMYNGQQMRRRSGAKAGLGDRGMQARSQRLSSYLSHELKEA